MDSLRDPFAPLPPGGETTSAEADAGEAWAPILPAPMPAPATMRHRRHGAPSASWAYRDAAGRLLFIVCRFDPPNGKKEVLPLVCGAHGWRWQAAPAPRPLYGLDRLAARPDAPVLVVEGEKAADAAAALFPAVVPIAWPGGTQAVQKADWTPLRGRVVAVWPDNDQPGRKAADAVVKAATAAGARRVALVPVPEDWPAKWDVADPLPAGVTADALRALVAQATAEPTGTPGDVLRAEVARVAAMPRTDYLAIRRDVAQHLRVPVHELDALRGEALRAAEAAEPRQCDAEGPTDPRGRRDLFINAADLPDTAAEVGAILATVPHLFDRGGPARLARDVGRDCFVVEPLTCEGVITEAHAVARPWTWTKQRNGDAVRTDVTLGDRVARLYLDNRPLWQLRPLDGTTSAPLLHDDGGVRVAEGYDETTRLWCERVPAIELAETPSREDAEAALVRLRQHFRTLAFADAERVFLPGLAVPVVDVEQPAAQDESAFLVGLLTAICRPCLPLAPAVVIRAPQYSGSGTGKGLAVRCIAVIAFGIRPTALTSGGTPEEFEKRVSSALMEAGPVLFLDNINGRALKSEVLASAITERPAAVRLLGSNSLIRLNPTAFIAITGNGLALSEDLARRFLTVDFDAGVEDPETREFAGDLFAETLRARPALLRDVLTIWRWGRQTADTMPAGKPLGSFSEWGRWCRDPLLALGCADPAVRVATMKAQDPRRQRIAEFFDAWWSARADAPVRVAALADGVRDAAGQAGQSRQAMTVMVRSLVGTRAAGFVLTLEPTQGRWSGDRYVLRQVPEETGRATPL